ncbi:hypothetical protein [Photobacterium sp. 1_MG-2023]|uniref:hypothetical protein n=1 Tax=Photobacterium sp. 1_MG-2023 TaxID=3062646 RepID=UPI0026E167AE|nr:hypothetical protein [Photobacterium sp. 1_MG-2023]MDO6708698.1 hypothetical protein [Photobacterium sp. 1_MG-2023]
MQSFAVPFPTIATSLANAVKSRILRAVHRSPLFFSAATFVQISGVPLPSLSQHFQTMGVNTLPMAPSETTQLTQFLSQMDSEFARLVTQHPEKSEADLLLGLMTKTHLAALEQLQSTQEKSQALNALFTEQLGEAHAERFQNQHHNHARLVTQLWMLVLGFQGIDVSYAAEHAGSSARQFCPNDVIGPTQSPAEIIRRQFMQAYYHGQNSSQSQSGNSGISPYRWLQGIFRRWWR